MIYVFSDLESLENIIPAKSRSLPDFLNVEKGSGSIFGQLLLEYALNKEYSLSLSELEIAHTPLGKPYFTQRPDIKFSISHSKSCAACILSEHNCGIDIENLRRFPEKVLKRVCSKTELDFINYSDDKNTAAFLLWTLKESYAKTTGEGIRDMKNISFSLDNEILCSNQEDFFFRFHRALPDFILSVCQKSFPPELSLNFLSLKELF